MRTDAGMGGNQMDPFVLSWSKGRSPFEAFG